MNDITAFRDEVRSWLEEYCPEGARAGASGETGDAMQRWRDALIEQGWTVPLWPKEYGGGGLDRAQARVLAEELGRIRARPAIMGGMGTGMLGPTLLEYGTEEQKKRHLIPITRGETRWCQGYSEPGAGSDLAGVQTKAVDKGDHFLINGQKIWTSGAQFANRMFALVRTDPDAPKHEGISFVLLDMDQPGITVKPIRTIGGNSPFNEVFFDDAIAQKEDLIGELNHGWTVGKRLLQHERSGQGGLGGVGSNRQSPRTFALADTAKQYRGEKDGRIEDAAVRDRVLTIGMNQTALQLTQRRVMAENRGGETMSFATSIFKYVSTNLTQELTDLRAQMMGTQGIGWEGDSFDRTELDTTRGWLGSRAMTIYGGSNEIQLNIIAKRVLDLPD